MIVMLIVNVDVEVIEWECDECGEAWVSRPFGAHWEPLGTALAMSVNLARQHGWLVDYDSTYAACKECYKSDA